MRKLLLAIALLLFASPLYATQQVVRAGEQELRLLETQCSHAGTLIHLKPEWHDRFKNARLLKNGTILFYACWILSDENTVFVMFEDEDSIFVPKKLIETEGA
jgi:hypothetical protein